MKIIRKIFFVFLFAFVFILVSCGKKNGVYNGEIKENELSQIIYTLSHRNTDDYMFDEETFKVDPNDSTYEIGYAYFSGLNYRAHKDWIESEHEYSPRLSDSCLSYRKVRRNAVTKEVDENYISDIYSSDEVDSYEIYSDYNYNNKKDCIIYLRTYEPGVEKSSKLSGEELFNYLPYEIWKVPSKDIKYDKDSEEVSFRYNNSDWIKTTNDNLDKATGDIDFVAKDKNGNVKLYITTKTIFDFVK